MYRLLSIVLVIISQVHSQVPSWVTYPGDTWEWLSPSEAGLNISAWNSYKNAAATSSSCGGDIHTGNRWGACVARGGYMLHCWGGDDPMFQTASVGKAFNGFALQIAIDKGLVTGSEHISDVWPGVPHHCGTRSTLDNIFFMRGGYYVSNGTGDGCDNTRCATGDRYSSGGMWRLNQALTYIFNKDLKTVLDEEIFSKIGIKAENWQFLSGEFIHSNQPPPFADPAQKVFYPNWSNSKQWYGCFVDPPYDINGHKVLGGGGWVIMTPKDFCRIGLLLASDGYWKGQKLISKTNRVNGNSGCGDSDLRSDKNTMFSWGKVSTKGVRFPSSSLVAGPIQTNKVASLLIAPAGGELHRFGGRYCFYVHLRCSDPLYHRWNSSYRILQHLFRAFHHYLECNGDGQGLQKRIGSQLGSHRYLYQHGRRGNHRS